MPRQSDKWCKHRTSFMEPRCKAGVVYLELAAKDTLHRAPMMCLPCCGDDNGSMVPCEKHQAKTPEEIAAREAEIQKRHEMIGKARKAIVESLNGPWGKGMKGSTGEIVCPCCNAGRLRFKRSGYNGHIHAACNTHGCVSWME